MSQQVITNTEEDIRLVAIVRAKPGHEHAVMSILKAAVGPSREEPGCLEYALHQDRETDGRFVFIERWADAGALAAHEQTEYFQRLGDLLPPHVEGGGEIIRLKCLD